MTYGRVGVAAMVAAVLLSGCATGTDGIVPIGPNLYMTGGLGKFTDFSSSAVKARLYKDAAEFCAGKGLAMNPINSIGKDSAPYQYASAEIQFECIKRGEVFAR